MSKKKHRQFTPEEKVAILRLHLLEQKPISEICEAKTRQPSVYYRWQKQFFEQGTAAFSSVNSEKTQVTKLKQQVAALKSKLQIKNEVVSELMEEHILLKKRLGDINEQASGTNATRGCGGICAKMDGQSGMDSEQNAESNWNQA